MKPLCLMVVAVEPSGDALGAGLIAALRDRLGDGVRFVGVGGARMAEAGIVSPFDPASLAIIGVFNALHAYPTVLRRVDEAAALAARERPDAAILIDAWGFNLRLARRLRRAVPGIRLIKYVAPQVWATRPGRARTLAGAVDHLLTIHAFDAPTFRAAGLPTTFVGNPVLSFTPSIEPSVQFRTRLRIPLDAPVLAIFPGSRTGEVRRLMGPFKDAIARLKAGQTDLRVIIAAAEPVADQVRSNLAHWTVPVDVVEGEADRWALMRAATAALACSGTVTTQIAIAGCPMVVAYRLGPLTHAVALCLLRTKFITLLNVAAGSFVAPERVQYACTGKALARDLGALLSDPDRRDRQIVAQTAALDLMRGGVEHPLEAAARAIADIVESGKKAAS